MFKDPHMVIKRGVSGTNISIGSLHDSFHNFCNVSTYDK